MDAADTAATLRTPIRIELTPRYIPGQIITVPSLPRTPNGKKCAALSSASGDNQFERQAIAEAEAGILGIERLVLPLPPDVGH